MVSNPRRHRGRDPERAMNPAQIVVREMQRDSRLKGREFFRESQREAVQPLQGQSHGQVIPFHIGGTDPISLRLAGDCGNVHTAHLRGAVPPWARVFRRVVLDQRRVMHVVPKGLLNRFKTRSKAVSRNLRKASCSITKVLHEAVSGTLSRLPTAKEITSLVSGSRPT